MEHAKHGTPFSEFELCDKFTLRTVDGTKMDEFLEKFPRGGGGRFQLLEHLRCPKLLSSEPVVSVYCEGSSWVGEPEKGIWCYTRPENPGPREDFDEEGGSGDEGSEEDRLGSVKVL